MRRSASRSVLFVLLTLLAALTVTQAAAQAGGDHKSLRAGVWVSEALGLVERTGQDDQLVVADGVWFAPEK